MTHYTSAVYEPTDPDMPLVAVILDGDEVTAGFTVSSESEGERKLRLELRRLKDGTRDEPASIELPPPVSREAEVRWTRLNRRLRQN